MEIIERREPTTQEIIKALRCSLAGDAWGKGSRCDGCYYEKVYGCRYEAQMDAAQLLEKMSWGD